MSVFGQKQTFNIFSNTITKLLFQYRHQYQKGIPIEAFFIRAFCYSSRIKNVQLTNSFGYISPIVDGIVGATSVASQKDVVIIFQMQACY